MNEVVQIHITQKKKSYPVIVGENIAAEFQTYLKKYASASQVAVITSDHLYSVYTSLLNQIFDWDKTLLIVVPDGEKSKSNAILQDIYSNLLKNNFERNSLIIAFGGGVIGDLAGFASATFLRGIQLIQFPTTLLAQVDSSIGGKVGINHDFGKNLIGAFKHPLFVFSDISLLKTLPEEELLCGLGEVVKYGLIKSKKLFHFLEKDLQAILKYDVNALKFIVSESAKIKTEIVQQDEKEDVSSNSCH